MRTLTTLAILLAASLPASAFNENETNRFKVCREYLKQANFTPTMGSYAEVFVTDSDQGVLVADDIVKRKGFKHWKSEIAHTFQQVIGKGDTYSILQVDDLKGEPRIFRLTELAFLWAPGALRTKQQHLYKSKFEMRNGHCLPTEILKVEGGREVKVFDFDQCRKLLTNVSVKPGDLDCLRVPVLREALNDSKFSSEPAGPAPSNRRRVTDAPAQIESSVREPAEIK